MRLLVIRYGEHVQVYLPSGLGKLVPVPIALRSEYWHQDICNVRLKPRPVEMLRQQIEVLGCLVDPARAPPSEAQDIARCGGYTPL